MWPGERPATGRPDTTGGTAAGKKRSPSFGLTVREGKRSIVPRLIGGGGWEVPIMWKCDCGEFNNDDLEFCVRCQRPRLTELEASRGKKAELKTKGMFRRIQDFILLDIAFCAMVALYCFLVEDIGKLLSPQQLGEVVVPEVLKTTLPIIAIVLFQILLLINVLRMLYDSALRSERNGLFLERIYRMLREESKEEKKPEEHD
jgi:hypothetical protein